MKLFKTRPVALSIVASLLLVPVARADEAADFAARLKTLYASVGVTAELGAATTSGNDITYDGLTINAGAGEDAVSYKVDTKLQFTGVSTQADGSFHADALKVPDVDVKSDNGEFTVKNIVFKDIYLPAGSTPSMVDLSRLFGSGSAGPIAVTADGTQALTIDSLAINNTYKPGQTDPALAEIDSSFSTSGLKIDFSGIKDADSLAQIKAFDLVQTTGKIAENISWTLKDGHLDFSEFSAQLDKVGKFSFAFDLSGYTPELLQQFGVLEQQFAQMQSSPDQGNQQKAIALLLNSLQTLFLNSVSFRYDDDSITGKALDMFAKQQNVDRAALVDALVAQIPAQLNDTGDSVPVGVVQATQAATRAFLTDPRSIEVKLAPKSPLGVLGIIAAVMAPTDLKDQIGLHIIVDGKEITDADAAKETGTAPAGPPPTTEDNSGSDDNSGATDDSGGSDNSGASDDNSGSDNSGASDDGSGGDDNSSTDDSAGSDNSGTSDQGEPKGHSK